MSFLDWIRSLWPWRKQPIDPPPPIPGDMLAYHNAERLRRAVRPLLAGDARLDAAALAGAQFIARLGRGPVHPGAVGGPDEGVRATAAGYPWRALAENVAADRGMTAAQAFALWMDDPPHAANAMNPRYADAGFGSAVGSDGWTYFVAVYGAKQ